MPRRTRLFLPSLLLLTVLLGVPVLLTWRAVRQASLDRALILAVRERKASAVVSLLKEGADPNAREHDDAPLSFKQAFLNLFRPHRRNRRVQEGHPALLLALLPIPSPQAIGRDGKVKPVINYVETVDESGETETTESSSPFGVNSQIVDALLNAGANPNCKDADVGIWTPLHFAVIFCPDEVPRLLEKGANVNAQDKQGMTPLMYASIDSRASVVKALLRWHADINIINKNEETAYRLARRYGNLGVAALLKQAGAKE